MPHYFDSTPDVGSRPKEIAARIRGIDLVFETDRGVFSPDRIDFGTQLLIKTVAEDLTASGTKKGRLLDIGCGYGPVGIALKRAFPALSLTMSDVNERSIRLAKRNAVRNGVVGAEIVVSDGFLLLKGSFDIVVTNPPVRAGKAIVYSFFDSARERLAPGGRLYVVLQRKQGAPSAAEKLASLFGHCDAIEIDAGYRVLRCVKKEVTEEPQGRLLV